MPAEARQALERCGPGPHVVTIGNFDGVHRGHQYLMSLVVDEARRHGVHSLVVTFEPHPTTVLRPDVPFTRLTSPQEKLRLIRATGVDDIAVIPFTVEFATLEPDEFLQLLHETVRPLAVFVGEGFRFGHNRAGDGATIRAFGERAGFVTTVVPRLRDGDQVISSSSVRAALLAGDVGRARAWLGRPYRLSGTVVRGAGRGRELGFPTANIPIDPLLAVPADGIYAAWAELPGEASCHQALAYIGSRPTFDNGQRVVEVHVLDYSGDLYDQEIAVEFVDFVRGDQAFSSIPALIDQMRDDERAIRRILASEQGT